MTRHEYMYQLKAYLKHLPKNDFQDTIDYFEEYFDEVGLENEETVMEELGSPRQAASDILANLYGREKVQEKPKAKNMIWLIILSLLAAPLGLPLALTLILLFIAFLLLLFSVLALIASLWMVLFFLGISLVVLAIDVLSLSWPSAFLSIGFSLISIYFSIIGTRLTIAFSNKAFLRCIHWFQARIQKGVSYEKTP